MKQLFFKSVLSAVFLPLLFLSSCKKDDSNLTNNISKRTPIDDQDVEVQLFNLDLNTNRTGDTVISAFGLDFEISFYKSTDFRIISFYTDYTNTFLQNEVVFRVGERSDYFLPSFLEGYKIDTYKYAWVNLYDDDNWYGTIYIKEDGSSFGVNGFGDRFIPYRKKEGTSYHYGYIKLNLSADANNLTIKSVAYCSEANKTFYFGDF